MVPADPCIRLLDASTHAFVTDLHVLHSQNFAVWAASHQSCHAQMLL